MRNYYRHAAEINVLQSCERYLDMLHRMRLALHLGHRDKLYAFLWRGAIAA